MLVVIALALSGCDGDGCWPGGDGLDVARAYTGQPVKNPAHPDDPPGVCDEREQREYDSYGL